MRWFHITYKTCIILKTICPPPGISKCDKCFKFLEIIKLIPLFLFEKYFFKLGTNNEMIRSIQRVFPNEDEKRVVRSP